MSLDHHLSHKIFAWAGKKRSMRELAIFCASLLIWLMAGFGIGLFFPFVHTMFPVIFLPWGVSILISEWIRRPRPFFSEHYKPLIHLAIPTPSFPSQHSTIAFSFVALCVDRPDVWPWMLITAMFVALGRLAVGVHYVSDVLVGAIIGLGFGFFVKMMMILIV